MQKLKQMLIPHKFGKRMKMQGHYLGMSLHFYQHQYISSKSSRYITEPVAPLK